MTQNTNSRSDGAAVRVFAFILVLQPVETQAHVVVLIHLALRNTHNGDPFRGFCETLGPYPA